MRKISMLALIVVGAALAVPAAAASGRGGTGEAKLQRALVELADCGSER